MKDKKIFPLLISMALPMIVSMLINSLYNIIDSIFIAKLGESAMTAISLVYPVQNIIIAIAVGFGVALNALIAFHLGANEHQKANAIATQGLILSVIHGLLLSVIAIPMMPRFLSIFTKDSLIIDYGIRYSRIVLFFAVIVMVSLTFEKLFQSVGKMLVSMICMLIGCLINIILDPIMIFGLGPIPAMGIEGAAYATIIGQIITLLSYVACYFLKPIPVHFHFNKKNMCFRYEYLGKLYGIGIPASLNMALPSLLISSLNGILSTISETGVLVLGVYYKLQSFIYLSANGVIQGMRPILSFNHGACEKKRVRSIYLYSLGTITVLMSIGTLICYLIPTLLMGLFTSQEETIFLGSTALRIISCGFIFSSISVTSSGALEALGHGIQSLIISLMRYVILILPMAFILSKFLGMNGVWHAFWMTEIITAFVAFSLIRKRV